MLKKYNIKKTIFLLLFLAFGFFVYMYVRNMASGGEWDTLSKVIDIAYVLYFVIAVVVFAVTMYCKNFRLEYIYLVCVLGLGFIVTILIPLKAVPDEATHLNIAYELSNDFLGIERNTNGTLTMRYDDSVRNYEPKEITSNYLDMYYDSFFQGLENSDLVDTDVIVADAPIYLYLLSGLGIVIGRLLGLGTTITFMLGRCFNLLAFALISYYAIKKVPFGKAVVFVWAMLPIMLQQIGSYSYDSMINALAILTVCLTLYFMYGEKTESKRQLITEGIILIVADLLLIPCKSCALIPISLLPLMIIIKLMWDKKADIRAYISDKPYRKRVLVGVIIVASVTIIGVCIFVVKSILATADANGTYVAWASSYARTIGYYIKNPSVLVSMFVNTIWAKGDELFVQMIGGSLGWINIKVPIIFVIPFFLLLFYAGARREDESQPISVASKAWMWIVFLGICVLACLGMLLYWTPASLSVIQGVQGRYFLPALVLPFIASRTKTTQVSKNADKMIVYAVIILYIFVITSLIKMYL